MSRTDLSESRDPERYPDPMESPVFKNPKTNIVRMTVVATSLAAVFCLIQRHRIKAIWKQKYFNLDHHTYTYFHYNDVLCNVKDQQYNPENTKVF